MTYNTRNLTKHRPTQSFLATIFSTLEIIVKQTSISFYSHLFAFACNTPPTDEPTSLTAVEAETVADGVVQTWAGGPITATYTSSWMILPYRTAYTTRSDGLTRWKAVAPLCRTITSGAISFIPQSALRQVHSLFQSHFTTECDLLLPLSISSRFVLS